MRKRLLLVLWFYQNIQIIKCGRFCEVIIVNNIVSIA